MPNYLFVFGYESPAEWRTNSREGTDFESSSAIWISAESKEEAMVAGRMLAANWVSDLFHTAGIAEYEGWSECDFACWIEDKPLEKYSGLALESFQQIIA